MLVKKNKTLKSEIENHEPRINFVRNNGQKLIDENNSQSEEFEQQIADLQEKLAHLKENLEARNVKLLMSEKVQQFFFDANEAEAWMSEQGNYKIDNYKVEKILKGSLDSISSPSSSVKIQIIGGKVCFRCRGKTFLGIVHKLLNTKVCGQREGDGIKSRLSS